MTVAPHSSTLAWKIPWAEEPGGLQSMGSLRLSHGDMTERLHFHFSLSCIGEGNGNPFQCSCLENPRDGGAWWAAIYGVAQSRTQLKQLSSSSNSKQSDNMQPWYTPFPIWNQSVVPCLVLTVTLDLHTDFSGGRSGGLVFPSLSEFSSLLLIHTVKGFGVVNKAKAYVFL